MNTLFVGQNKITLTSVDSTNNYAAKLIKMSYVPEGTVIMAQSQTNGRGQRENRWLSDPGQNLLVTFILYPKTLGVQENFLMSMISAMAVRETIKNVCNSDEVCIKWPNDIILNDQKVGGILIENSIIKDHVNYSIIGMGINVNQNQFAFGQATSVRNETDRIIDTDGLLNSLSTNLESWYLKIVNGHKAEIVESYNKHLWKKGIEKKLRLNSSTITGKLTQVDPSGILTITHRNETFSSDQYDIKIPYE